MSQPVQPRPGSADVIPSLNGLRALSIALVIFGHSYQHVTGSPPDTAFWVVAVNAALGLEIFFVISGFIITTLLLREFDKTQDISLRNFYGRRAVRILPALYAYVAVVGVLWALRVIAVRPGAFATALTFTTDYLLPFSGPPLAHTWSLSVEEQFYLFWPALLFLVLRRYGRSTAAKVAVALIVAAPVMRIATYVFAPPFFSERLYYMLHTRVDALMFGCLAALLSGAVLNAILASVRRFVWVVALFVFVLSPILTLRFGGAYIYPFGYTLEGLGIALVMLWAIRESGSAVGRFLNWAPVVHVGLISYSLYLWQGMFLHSSLSFPLWVAIAATVVCAELSFFLVEGPTRRFRHRFVVKTKTAAGLVGPHSGG